ncbi:unnamed protein product [Dovyalis caffra]|uniref:Uncharacterized protein n=1 Tax=Dovyalis caffra TaxID=77055 RepID=A0AAV1R5C8_9ROSI|nr:unnamed protein product [Dovyalis caffra]
MVVAPAFWGAGGATGASLTISLIGPSAGSGPSALRLAGAGGEEISPSGAPAGLSPATGEATELLGASEMVGESAAGALAGALEDFGDGDGDAEGVAAGASAANAPATHFSYQYRETLRSYRMREV